ncbi:RNA methyltransferase substrate-binding domain-containing protein [Chromatiaceae bacterium AAb-1]|nr:RNA methyltransferase substrate-binding domain-containing protein [Chromatiaceae bacterium AAb-1]
MSQHKGKGGKAPNPLHKPWTKDANAKNARATANKAIRPAAVKVQGAKPVRAVMGGESKVYGANACRVLFQQRPDAVIRLYLSSELAPQFADVMKYLAAAKKAYHVVDENELEKVAASQHHGGIVMLVKRRQVLSLAAYLNHNRKKQDCLLALDGVGNPHKIGNTISDFF